MNIAVIPARGGSRRIPKKNIRLFHGKPIIGYSIAVARATGLFWSVIVSTDDAEIAKVATDFGARVHERPKELADDTKHGTQEVTRDVVQHYPQCEYACCIYATAPLMVASDIVQGHRLIRDYGSQFAFSVGSDPLQDAAQFYWGRAQAFLQRVPLIGPDSLMVPIKAERVCDINTEEDWQRALAMHAALPCKSPLGYCDQRGCEMRDGCAWS